MNSIVGTSHEVEKMIILHDFHTNNFNEMNFKVVSFMKKDTDLQQIAPQGRNSDLDFYRRFRSKCFGKNNFDRKIAKNGHWKSLEPKEFKDWLNKIKTQENHQVIMRLNQLKMIFLFLNGD